MYAAEKPEADGKRFFIVAGGFTNGEVAGIIKRNFPEASSLLPESFDASGYKEGQTFSYNNTRSKEVLGIQYISLEDSIVDTVKSLKAIGA